MPHRNRVLPGGEIVTAGFRGAWMGNRGGPVSELPGRRQWANTHWIYCKLAFNGRERVFREPGRKYTELFFYDEAVALAAGHRPCGECQFHRLREYKTATFGARTTVDAIDTLLHRQRRSAPDQVEVGELPAGTFIRYQDRDVLLWSGTAYAWDGERGYTELAPPATSTRVQVLTPLLSRRALAAGFSIRPRLVVER
ncbi:hypothetical protein K7711_44155 [Nocardia sp. CA2R105]|uniref:hypothetical protein n=1 Tax=Nocardia coffeae TaxID=2873381 RepID=UPI001CA70045|nr:hypothetical protein [Nocardia coffeae]MBY8863527.1 hypothetical protein [Nocardia coffeae]